MAHFSSTAGVTSEFHGPTISEIAAEKRSKRNPRQLDFDAAMLDFKIMFPDKAEHIIESVLRKNNGSVEATIDQLLKLPVGIEDEVYAGSPPLLPPKPKSSLDTPGPVLPPRQGSLKRNKHTSSGGRLSPNSTSPDTTANQRREAHRPPVLYNTPHTMYDVPWGDQLIPMLGRLPSNFLRLEKQSPEKRESPPPRPPKKNLEANRPKHRSVSLKHTLPLHLAVRSSPRTPDHDHWPITDVRVSGLNTSRNSSSLPGYGRKKGHITTPVGERLSTNAIKRQIEANQKRLQESVDLDADRFLEDERLALIVQNEEFLRELKRNEDFMRTLEFERDLLATRLAVEQSKNKVLRDGLRDGCRPNTDLSPGAVSNWMIPMPSERDDLSIQRSISSASSKRSSDENHEAGTTDLSPLPTDTLPAAMVPVDRSDNHDFKDQLKSMGASSKKKFALLAKKFFGKKSSKRGPVSKAAREGRGVSTLNLLDDSEDSELPWTSEVQGSSVDVLFEPLPDNWTRSKDDDDRHFL